MSRSAEIVLSFVREQYGGSIGAYIDPRTDDLILSLLDRSKRLVVRGDEFYISRAELSEYLERLLFRIQTFLFPVHISPPLPRNAPAIVRIRMAERAREARRKKAA